MLGCGLYRPHHNLSVQLQWFSIENRKKMTGHVQNKEQSLLKQETLYTISRLSIPLQNDAVGRGEPQLTLENGILAYIYPSSPQTEL